MFDNFGTGEFLTIAFFALLFFGPERLPKIGAAVGGWLRKLTDQSRLFMTQWREEALAIQDAVEEVRGIRDEILAARQELASTIDHARSDIDESITDAKSLISTSSVTLEQVAHSAPASPGVADASKVEAFDQTHRILDDMLSKRQEQMAPQATVSNQPLAPTQPDVSTVTVARDETVAPTAPLSAVQEPMTVEGQPPAVVEPPVEEQDEDEWTKTKRLIDEMLKPRPPAAPTTTQVIAPSSYVAAGVEQPPDNHREIQHPVAEQARLESLTQQVTSLQSELQSLRAELAFLRSLITSQAPA